MGKEQKGHNRRLADLINRAIEIVRQSGLAPGRCKQLEMLCRHSRENTLRVGTVGITSSGKSTFINALMGEPLLPEETRATSNLLVRCRWGEERQLIVNKGKGNSQVISDPELISDWIKNSASEKNNPGNQAGITFLEWSTPASLIPRNLILVDTPGLDAFGLPEHEELTLRQFLPFADIIIYISSIRNPFKPADLKLISSIIENDQRVLFVQSQIDLERHDLQGGEVWQTKEEKLRSHRERLKGEIKQQIKLDAYGVVQVSSKLAKEAHGNLELPQWKASNFDAVMEYLSIFSRELRHRLIDDRGHHLLSVLQETLDDLQTILLEKDGASFKKRITTLRAKIDKLAVATEQVQSLVKKAEDTWAGQLDVSRRIEDFRRGYSTLTSVSQIRSKWQEDMNHLNVIRGRFLKDLDTKQSAISQVLDSEKVPHQRKFAATRLDSADAPDLESYVVTRTAKVKKRGWFDNILFWPSHETVMQEKVDKDAFLQAIFEFIPKKLTPLYEHLKWWKGYSVAVYLDPLTQELSAEKTAYKELTGTLVKTEAQLGRVQEAVKELEDLCRNVKTFLAKHDADQPTRKGSVVAGEKALEGEGKNGPAASTDGTAAGRALNSLMWKFQETGIQKKFRELISSMVPATVSHPSLLLLGQHRDENLNLLALLAHNLGWAGAAAGVSADQWVTSQNGTRITLNQPAIIMKPPKTILQHLTITVAPADKNLQGMDWELFMKNFDLVGVAIDASRISSGLSDLFRAPYFEALHSRAERVFFSCGHGAMFDDKLNDLVIDVVPKANEYWGYRQEKEREPLWFVYENYDARYTNFIELAQTVVTHRGTAQELVRQWRSNRLPLYPPFDANTLNRVMQEIIDSGEGCEGP
jgi:predicted GTPase